MNGTVEQRVHHAYRLLVLIEAAAAVNELQVPIDVDDLREAIGAAAHDAAETLAPLRRDVPFDVSNWSPGGKDGA